MTRPLTRRALLARSGSAAACGLAGLALPARAQNAAFPSRPVRLIVPTAPGAGMDAVTRLVADKLSRTWNKPVLVDNRPGGNYLVGYNAFKAAQGDPHTLFMADAGFISIQPNLPAAEVIEPRKVFRPVTDLFYTGFVMLARPDRFGSLQALLKAAKERPGTLNYHASGNASGIP